jgi:hypothetical protein
MRNAPADEALEFDENTGVELAHTTCLRFGLLGEPGMMCRCLPPRNESVYQTRTYFSVSGLWKSSKEYSVIRTLA